MNELMRGALTAALLLALWGGDVAAAPPPESAQAPSVYRARREALMKRLGGDCVALLYGASGGHDGRFHQSSDFFYLTGIEEPGAALLLTPKAPKRRHQLFLESRDPEAERWTGERPAVSGALAEQLGFDRVTRSARLGGALRSALRYHEVLCNIAPTAKFDQPLPRSLEVLRKAQARQPGLRLRNHAGDLMQQRMVKSPEEIALIKQAIAITEKAHRQVLGAMKAGLSEFEVESRIDALYRAEGALRPAFTSIVGAGAHSTVLHYTRNTGPIAAGDLIVIDIGAEYRRYAADITRTVPADCRFTKRQREIYDIVLKAQAAGLKQVKPGSSIHAIHDAAVRVIADAGYAQYFIHGTSHFLGLDVHDVGDRGSKLEAGMVLTVEPGIYIPEEKLGVRIEDDLLVTRYGYEILSDGVPRDAAGIEKLCGK